MKKLTYHWAICAACAFLLFCTVGFTSTNFATFLPYIIKDIGLTNTQGALLTTIRSATSFLIIFCYDWFYSKFNARVGAALTTLNVGLSFALYALADNFAVCCAAVIVGGISYGLGGLVLVSVIMNRWFKSRIGLAVGLASCGTGVSSTFLPPIITVIIEGSSLKTAFAIVACFCLVASIIIFKVIRDWPSDLNMDKYYDENDKAPSNEIHLGRDASRGVTVCIMTAMFIIGVIAFCGVANLSVLLHETDLSSVTISFALSLFGAMLMTGKFCYGECIDKLGSIKTGFIFIGLVIAGTVLCIFSISGNAVVITAAMICFGLGMAVASVAMSIYARDISSAENYTKAAKKLQIMYMAGSMSCATIPGIIADVTGSYVYTYVILSILAVILLALVEGAYYRMKHQK